MTHTKTTQIIPIAGRPAAAAQALELCRRYTRKQIAVSALAWTMLMIGGQGCVAEIADSDDDIEATQSALTRSSDGEEVASVQTAAGTLVTFVSGADDEFGIAILGTIGRADAELDRAWQSAGGDPIGFYELLAGTRAPATLQTAVRRAESGAFRENASDKDKAAIPSETSSPTVATELTTASALCNIYNWAHSGSSPFEYCWPNQYSTPWVRRWADHMSCRFDSISGPQRVRYRYQSGGSWHTSVDVWLSSGQYMQWTGSYQWAQRLRECMTVDNPSSRQHHFRVVGHEWLAPLGFNPVEVSFPSP